MSGTLPKALKGAACGPAGALKHRVALQDETRTPDGYGGDALSWTTVSGASALPSLVTPVSGREYYFSRKLDGVTSHVVTLRYRAGVTPKQRLLFGSRPLNIRSVLNLEEAGEWLELDCTEGQAV